MCSNWKHTAGVVLLVGSLFPALAQQLPPTTRKDDFRESFYGKELVDPYHWLEDSASPETPQWIDAQNTYAHALLDPLPIRAEINQRLTQMMRHDVIGRPEQRNGYYYFNKRGAGEDLWSFYRRKITGGSDELLLDPHPLSKGHTTSIAEFDVSDDGRYVAYGVRQGGQDETDLRVLDVTAHRDLADHLPPALYRGLVRSRFSPGRRCTLRRPTACGSGRS